MDYSIVIPVYKSTAALSTLTDRLVTTMSQLNSTFEIFLIDDSSPSLDSWNTITSISKKYECITGVRLSRNFGQQAATLCGLKLSRGNFIITLDDDLQHSPEDIPKLISKQKHSIVIAHFEKKSHSLKQRIFSKIKGYFDHIILNKPRHIQLTAFRLLQRHVVNGMLEIQTPFPFIPALMLHVSQDIVAVPVDHHARVEGQTGYTFYSQLKLFSRLIINNSSLMLRLIGQFGFFISILSVLAIVALLVNNLLSENLFPGWTSTMIVVVLFGGLQMLGIGVIGEYLIRVIKSSEQSPPYHIKELVGNK